MDPYRLPLTNIVVTETQLVLAVIVGGLWCGGTLAVAATLALLNRRK